MKTVEDMLKDYESVNPIPENSDIKWYSSKNAYMTRTPMWASLAKARTDAFHGWQMAMKFDEETPRICQDDELSPRSRIGELGNMLHNLSCKHQNDDELRDALGGYSSEAWDILQSMNRHWTDAHIRKDPETGKYIAYDEAGLEHSVEDTRDEARDALVTYGHYLNTHHPEPVNLFKPLYEHPQVAIPLTASSSSSVHLESLAKIALSESITVEMTHYNHLGAPIRSEEDISEHVAEWIRDKIDLFQSQRSQSMDGEK